MEQSAIVLSLSILVSSFLGSWHCAAMCGPIAANLAHTGKLWPYHLGRLLTYSSLGAAAGFSGGAILQSQLIWLNHLSVILLSLALLYSGWINLSESKKNTSLWLAHFMAKIQSIIKTKNSFIIGLLTGFLPCGWLYTYVLAAVASKSPYAGLLIMFLFWLGGFPALTVVPMLVRRSVQRAGMQQKKIAGYILIAAALYAITSHFIFGTGLIH